MSLLQFILFTFLDLKLIILSVLTEIKFIADRETGIVLIILCTLKELRTEHSFRCILSVVW